MKDNSRLYSMIRLLRLGNKISNPSSQAHLVLETLAEAAIILQDLEASHDAYVIPNPIQVEEILEGQK